MLKKKVVLAAVAAFALAAAGVAAAAVVTHPRSFRTLASSSSTGSVTLHTTKVGKVLATRTGMTLYLFRADKHGKSACYGQCATYWPPLLKKGALTAGTGVKAKLLGTTKRRNGTLQVTYAGHPLYRFKLDTKAGQTKGEGSKAFGAEWYVVSPKGSKVEKGMSSSSSSSTNTTSTDPYGGGYGG